MAIDAVNGTPQRYSIVQSRNAETVVLQFFSPVPKWAQRRWDALGERLVDHRGCLFSYVIPRQEVAEERRFLTTQLWLSENEGGQP
jgi:FPC/CPF motif-containing protein YcgG